MNPEDAETDRTRAIMQSVRDFIVTRFLDNEKTDTLLATTPLISSGLLDSIGGVELVLLLESELDTRFNAAELEPASYDTLEEIEQFVRAKLVALRSQ